MILFHLIDNASGLCVQSLAVLRNDMTQDEMEADLAASAAHQGRTVVDLTRDPSHVCAPGSALR